MWKVGQKKPLGFFQTSAILKFDFQKREQLRFSEVNYLETTQKRPNFACGNYIFPKTRGNKNKPWTHSTPLKSISPFMLYVDQVENVRLLFIPT